MKKPLLCALLSFAVLVVGCNGSGTTTTPVEDSVAVNPPQSHAVEKRLKPFLDDFVKAHPNLLDNSITKEEGAKELAAAFSASASSDSLACVADLPAKFEMMMPYPGEAEYVVKFAYSDFLNKGRRAPISEAYEVNYQVFAKMPKAEAAKLQNGKEYYLRGKFVGFLTPKTFRLPSGRAFTDIPSIGVCSRVDYKYEKERPDFCLGTLIVDGLSFVPAE